MSSNDGEFFYDDNEENTSESDKLYEHGTICVRRKASEMNKDVLLYLYARFKYVTEGPCNIERPGGFFNFEAKSKWDSWKALGSDKSKDKCKEEYIAKLDEILPNWRDGFQTDSASNSTSAEKKGTFGLRVSTMGQAEEIRPADMNCFDMCQEGSLDLLKEYFEKNKSNLQEIVNQTDDNKMTMLMWACDRGNLNIVKLLLDNKANPNLQDNDGQTCLHYAVSCEHLEIIKFLVNTKTIDINLSDNDGLKPIELTENKDIIELLKD